MSDFVSCCGDGVIDDVVLMERGILMMRTLFSNPVNFGPYAKVADKYKFVEMDHAQNSIDIYDWTERTNSGVYSRPSIFVNVDSVQMQAPQWFDDQGEPSEDGSTAHFVYMEDVRLVFRAVSAHGAEARLLGRIIMTYLQGMKNFLVLSSNGQLHHFRPTGKTAPTKLKDENNADNRWAVDVVVDVSYQIAIDSVLVAPVLEDIVAPRFL